VAAHFGTGFTFNQHPESCAFNATDQMYVGQADGTGQVLKLDTSGNLLSSFSPAGEDRGTDWIDLAKDEKTLHYTSEGTLIKQFDVSTNSQGPDFATGLPAPCYAHRILSDGSEIVACAAQAVHVSTSGAIVKTYPVDPNNNLFALNIDPDGTSFWTADFNGTIFHVDIATGNVINSFNDSPLVDTAGLAIVGEPTAAQDQKITATGASSFAATEGKSATATVATFTDPDTTAPASEYSASINWGDGSTSSGTIAGSGGSFTVTGTHTYAEEGSKTITVTITDTDNTANSATATTVANVADAALHASGVKPTLKGNGVSGTVASFTDDNPGAPVSDFTATINWGDGKSTSGKVTASGTAFRVSGSHTYSKTGTFTIKTTIKDDGGSTATASTTVTITAKKKKKPHHVHHVVHGSAKLKGVPAACVLMPFNPQVDGKRILSVSWTLDGRGQHGKTLHKGKAYSSRISLSPGSHQLKVKVKFVPSSHTAARTFRKTVSGCPIVAPKFTG
jgi:hypothetical protein